MKKYTTNWIGTITIFGVLAVFNAITFYLNRNPAMPSSKVIIGLIAWFIFISIGILIMTVFSYVSISDNILKYVWLFFSRRTIDIRSITSIGDQATFKVAKGQFHSLYIFYKDKCGDAKWIELRITIFPEKTLGALIKELKKINPRIELNKYAEKLMKSAS